MRKDDAALFIEDQVIYQYYRERLINIALAQFEWNGLPLTCDRRWLEKCLLYNGKAAFYQPLSTDFWVATDYVDRGKFDVYGYPTKISGYGYNGRPVATDTFMVLYDNMTRTTLLPRIDMFAKLLWEIHNTFRSNLRQQITPYIVLSNKNMYLSIKNFFTRVFGFQPTIQMGNGFDPETIKTLDLKVDFKGKEMLDVLKETWNMALSMLGISAKSTKRERSTDDEIMINRMEDAMSLNARLLNRVDFCNKFNKLYGDTVSSSLSVNLAVIDTSFIAYDSEGIGYKRRKADIEEGRQANV